jgi:hypothetical protein
MDSMVDSEGNIILLDFLQSICDGFSEATCYYNKLTPTINENNEIIFIDEIALPDRDTFLKKEDFKGKAVQTVGDGPELAKFNMFGYKESGGQASFIRDFSFRTEIPASFATMITVGAQARGLVVGEDATCLSKMNYGLTDRMKPEIIDANIDASNDPKEQLISNFYNSVIPITSTVVKFLKTVYGERDLGDTDLIDSMKNIGKDLVKLNKTIASINQSLAVLEDKTKNPYKLSPGSGFIPFNLQLTMDGLSGFKIYQKYTAEQEFLPTNYPESLDFIIKGITHNIENNQWTTVIESFGMPKNPEGSGHIKASEAVAQLNTNIALLVPAVALTPNLTAYDSNNTPRLRKAVLDQSSFVYNNFPPPSGDCGTYTYSIALNLKKHLDSNSTKAIPMVTFNQVGNQKAGYKGSGGNANTEAHRAGIMALGIYDKFPLGSFKASTLKAGYFNTLKWNYGDILNYYCKGKSGPHNMHSQIYTGDIWKSPSGWSTDVPTNYSHPSGFIYPSNDNVFTVTAFKIKKQYLV